MIKIRQDEIINDFIDRIGIKTIHENNKVFWEYNGIKVLRTNRYDWWNFINENFSIKIIV